MRPIDGDALLEQMKHRREYVGRPSDPVCLVEDAPTIGGWISVKDRLPDNFVYVLVWEKQGFAYCDELRHGVWNIGAQNGAIITHWMPLPGPPNVAVDQ